MLEFLVWFIQEGNSVVVVGQKHHENQGFMVKIKTYFDYFWGRGK